MERRQFLRCLTLFCGGIIPFLGFKTPKAPIFLNKEELEELDALRVKLSMIPEGIPFFILEPVHGRVLPFLRKEVGLRGLMMSDFDPDMVNPKQEYRVWIYRAKIEKSLLKPRPQDGPLGGRKVRSEGRWNTH